MRTINHHPSCQQIYCKLQVLCWCSQWHMLWALRVWSGIQTLWRKRKNLLLISFYPFDSLHCGPIFNMKSPPFCILNRIGYWLHLLKPTHNEGHICFIGVINTLCEDFSLAKSSLCTKITKMSQFPYAINDSKLTQKNFNLEFILFKKDWLSEHPMKSEIN